MPPAGHPDSVDHSPNREGVPGKASEEGLARQNRRPAQERAMQPSACGDIAPAR
ncbi:MAG: hypothetical protein ACLT8E_03955 [Akkermansia sp.]